MSKQTYMILRIQNWMKIRDKTPADMAYRMGCSTATWYRKMRMPETMTVADLTKLERITKLELIRGE